MTDVVKITSPVPRDLWRSIAASDPLTRPTQLPEWSDSIAAHRAWTDSSRAYTFASGRTAVLPMVARRVGVRVAERSWPNGWGIGGVIAPGGAREDELEYIAADLRRTAPLSTVALADRPWPDPHAGTRTIQVLDLAGGFDEVWSHRLRHNARNAVRRAEKAGVEVRHGTDRGLIDAFADVYRTSAERWAEDRHQPRVVSRMLQRQRDRAGQVAAAVAHMGDRCQIWLGLLDGAPVAVSVTLYHGPWAVGWMRAFDRRLIGKSQALHLLQKETIQHACEQGARWYDMGESDPGSGSEQVKRHFGAEPREISQLRVDRLAFHRVEALARRVVNRPR